jgi:hypothetical protein
VVEGLPGEPRVEDVVAVQALLLVGVVVREHLFADMKEVDAQTEPPRQDELRRLGETALGDEGNVAPVVRAVLEGSRG